MQEHSEWDENTPFYPIGVVANMLGIHPQTLRVYEREGLLKPSRNARNLRLYSQKDLKRLRFILTLTHDMGVNLAGVEVILRLLNERQEFNQRLRDFVEKIRLRWGEEGIPEPPFISEDTALVPIEQTALARRSRVAHPSLSTTSRKRKR